MSKQQRAVAPSTNSAPAGLKLSEIAERTGYSVGTIRLNCVSGKLKGYQIGPRGQWRVDPEIFKEWWHKVKKPNG